MWSISFEVRESKALSVRSNIWSTLAATHKCYRRVCCFPVSDVGSIESKEDILVLLTNIDRQHGHDDPDRHNDAVHKGEARQLAHSLHRLVRVAPPPPDRANNTDALHRYPYRTALEPTRALQVMATCRALELIVRGCSTSNPDTVKESLSGAFARDLSAALPRAIALFASLRGDSSTSLIRLSGLTSCIRLADRVGPVLTLDAPALVRSLMSLVAVNLIPRSSTLPQPVPSDLRVDAALAITRLFHRKSSDLVEMVEEEASTLISILSTGAMSVWESQFVGNCLGGLLRLARLTTTLPSKLVRRRCVILALCKHLQPNSMGEQRDDDEGEDGDVAMIHRQDLCIELAKVLLRAVPSRSRRVKDGDAVQKVVKDNLELLTTAVIRAVLQDLSPKIKLSVMELLVTLVQNDYLEAAQVLNIVNVLYFFAGADGPEESVIPAARHYIEAVRVHENAGALVCAVDLLDSPFASVRQEAFQLLIDLCFWKVTEAKHLLKQSTLLDHLAVLLKKGSKHDCLHAIRVSKQLIVFHQDTHATFCQHEAFLKALVGLVTNEPVRNRLAYAEAVDVMLELLSTDQRHRFIPFNVQLLPWLAKFANATYDEELKKRAVNCLVQYSSVLMQAN